MSRPTTRSKNKRQRQVDDGAGTSEIWRKIHETGVVTDDDINQLYMIWKPVCSSCRVNTKDNPNCFCALIPPPNGNRKSGLWQKVSGIVENFGPDPTKDLRESANSPAGLTNLGATCYANSILQCLYMNKCFREGIFSVEPDLLQQQPVLNQLVRLFVQLHISKRAFVDSFPFVKTLELDNGVQQDSHEFLTLLLCLLERCLSHSKIPKARTVVQDLFRGSVSHVTSCSQCGRDSEASSKMEDFYELELNVKGFKSLDESLNDYLAVEELCGDNQYFCASCKTRVDATRSIKLRTLPDVLNFQLKRCVFLPETTTRKKITSAFSFPAKLDMQPRLSEPSQSELIYDLSAVLIHKGTTVNSGHYVAHIKDEDTGQWWEFDDEHVTELGCHPFGDRSSNSSVKSIRTETVNSDSSEVRIADSNGNGPDASYSQSSLVETFSSSDAYMLMYNLKHSKNVVKMGDVLSNGDAVPARDRFRLLSHLFDEIQNLNASYVDECEKYNQRKELELSRITERRQEVRSVLAEAPVQPLEQPFYWISSDWLRQWADNINPSTLDNTSIQCSHGKVPVSKVTSMKRLSDKAWDKLFAKGKGAGLPQDILDRQYGGGPTVSHSDCCWDCLIDGARSVVSAVTYRDRRESMKQLARDILDRNCPDGKYYVSRPWLQQWWKRKVLDAPSEADAGPTAPISCPHGQLLPEQAAGAKRVLVPESFWFFLYEDALSVKPDDSLDCPTFPSDSVPCSQCSDELSEVACLEDSLKLVKQVQRQNHEKLLLAKSTPLSLHCKYFLVPSSWISKWRSYMSSSVKSSDKPETLDGIINSLMCGKHSLLVEKPLELVFRRGAIVQRESSAGGLTMISENDWKCFCEEWGGTETKGISATIGNISDSENILTGFSSETPICEDQLNDKVNNDSGTSKLVIKTCPEICESCIGERESCELMQKLNYSNENISVILVRGKEVPRSILEASKGSVETDRRVSKRSRKSKNGTSISLKVSASTSLYQLKMMIWEAFGVVKENQILQKGDRTIDNEDECATLADVNIFAGDQIIVRDSEIHENRDIADEICDDKMEMQRSEGGFRGTLLAADVSSQVV